jgi:neopullulanase
VLKSKSSITSLFVACLLVFTPLVAWTSSLQIDKVEPPHWWVGMKSQQLELMLRAPGINKAKPSLSYPGVKLVGTHVSDNPNYLWVTLQISAQAQPGVMNINLQHGQTSTQLRYTLQAREKNSAERQGFNSADVVLNLMPDRFANGDPSNDNQAGFDDPANRQSLKSRHGGDIAGIVQNLDHIASMGYTAIWSTPLIENKQPAFSYHGYASTDSYRIDPRYGSNEDYRQMVQTARKKGLKVIQDIVPNHIGDHHWWMRDLPSKDWLSNHNTFTPTNHARTTISDPYASANDRQGFTGGWFAPSMPDMNSKNPRVANYLIQNAIWWVEYAGISGIRVDTYGYSDKAFLNEWLRRILNEYPRLGIVGEEWTDNPAVQAYWARGRTQANGYRSNLPSVMDFVLQGNMLKAFAEPESWNTGLRRLYESLANDQLVAHPEDQMLFDGNHDTPRLFSVFDEDPDLTRMALAYLLTIKRTPQLYYGTEVLMTSPKKHDDFDAFRAGFPGGWIGDTVNAFTGEGLTALQKSHQQWLKKLLNWRKNQEVIHRGKLMHFVPENGTYVLVRYNENSRVMVIFNKNKSETPIKLDRFREVWPQKTVATNVMANEVLSLNEMFMAPARSVTILKTSLK